MINEYEDKVMRDLKLFTILIPFVIIFFTIGIISTNYGWIYASKVSVLPVKEDTRYYISRSAPIVVYREDTQKSRPFKYRLELTPIAKVYKNGAPTQYILHLNKTYSISARDREYSSTPILDYKIQRGDKLLLFFENHCDTLSAIGDGKFIQEYSQCISSGQYAMSQETFEALLSDKLRRLQIFHQPYTTKYPFRNTSDECQDKETRFVNKTSALCLNKSIDLLQQQKKLLLTESQNLQRSSLTSKGVIVAGGAWSWAIQLILSILLLCISLPFLYSVGKSCIKSCHDKFSSDDTPDCDKNYVVLNLLLCAVECYIFLLFVSRLLIPAYALTLLGGAAIVGAISLILIVRVYLINRRLSDEKGDPSWLLILTMYLIIALIYVVAIYLSAATTFPRLY